MHPHMHRMLFVCLAALHAAAQSAPDWPKVNAEGMPQAYDLMRKVIDDPAVEVVPTARLSREAAEGFGAHSDQERLLEQALYRFVQFNWEVVTALAARK